MRIKHRKKPMQENTVIYGDFGLVALDRKLITRREIEAARVVINQHIKREDGKLWIRISREKSNSKKSTETRIRPGQRLLVGKIRRTLGDHVMVIKPGTVMFELGGIKKATAEEAVSLVGAKFLDKSKFVSRLDMNESCDPVKEMEPLRISGLSSNEITKAINTVVEREINEKWEKELPVAKYDMETRRAYLETAEGMREYV